MSHGFKYIPKRRTPVQPDNIPRCEYCHARLDFITPWNQPHICKETTYQSMPVLPDFIPFTVEDDDEV